MIYNKLTAKEARLITKDIELCIRVQLENIFEEIRLAASEGLNFIILSGPLFSEIETEESNWSAILKGIVKNLRDLHYQCQLIDFGDVDERTSFFEEENFTGLEIKW